MKEVIAKQVDLGLDVVTDGEMPRESYYLHFVRHPNGIDMVSVEEKTMREGEKYFTT